LSWLSTFAGAFGAAAGRRSDGLFVGLRNNKRRPSVIRFAEVTPWDWLADGQSITTQRIPSRGDIVGFEIVSHFIHRKLHALVDLPGNARRA
jgi:hypothetical protein